MCDNLSKSCTYKIHMQSLWWKCIHWIKYMLLTERISALLYMIWSCPFFLNEIWHLTVESDSCICHTFPEEECVAKVNVYIQFSLNIAVMNFHIMLQWILYFWMWNIKYVWKSHCECIVILKYLHDVYLLAPFIIPITLFVVYTWNYFIIPTPKNYTISQKYVAMCIINTYYIMAHYLL